MIDVPGTSTDAAPSSGDAPLTVPGVTDRRYSAPPPAPEPAPPAPVPAPSPAPEPAPASTAAADSGDPVVALGRQYAQDATPPAPADDPVVKLGSSYANAYEAGLHASLKQASTADPDRAARVYDLSQKLNLPSDVVSRNLDLVESKQKFAGVDVGGLIRDHPELAQWLAVPDHSAVAQDDIPALRTIDLAMRAITNPDDDPTGTLPPGYAFDQLGRVTQRTDNGNHVVIGSLDEFRTEYVGWLKDLHDAEVEGLGDSPRTVQNLAGFFGSGTASAAINLSRLVGGVSPQDDQDAALLQEAADRQHAGVYGQTWRGAVGLASDLPLMFIGGLAGKAIPATTRIGQAARVVAAYAPINLAQATEAARLHGLGYGSASFLINSLVPAAFPLATGEAGGAARVLLGESGQVAGRGWAAAAVQLAKDIGVQVGQQEAQEALNAAHDYASGVDPNALNLDKLMPRLLTAAILASGQTGLMHAPGAIVEKFHRDTMAAHAGVTYATQVQTAIDAVKQSTLLERSPQLLTEAAAKLGGPNRLTFMQAESFDRLAKANGMQPIQAAEAMGARQSYVESLASGGDVAVPVEQFLLHAAKAENAGDLAQQVRPHPEAMTGAEGAAFRTAAPENVAKLREQVQAAAAQVQSDAPTRQVHDDLVAQLTAAGTEMQAAKRQATILAAGFRTLAERMNAGATEGVPRLNAKDLYDRYGLTIARADNGTPAAGQTFEQSGFTAERRAVSAAEAPVQERFARYLEQQHEEARARYAKNPETKGGRIIAADEAKRLSVDFERDGTLANAVHGPSAAFADHLYRHALATGEHPGPVMLLAGGAGAGKSTALAAAAARPGIVVDGILANYESARAKIEAALAAGRRVEIHYVHAPIEAAVGRMIDRALATHRALPLGEAADKHFRAQQTFLRLADEYRDNPHVKSEVIDNAGRPDQITRKSVEWLRAAQYSAGEEVRNRARNAYQAQRDRLDPEYALAFAADLEGAGGVQRGVGPQGQGSDGPGVVGLADRGPESGPGGAGRQVTDAGGTPPDSFAQAAGDTRRGQITFGNGATDIRLFEQKDLSTFLHEGGHLFLQVFGDLAAHEKAPPQIRDDYAKILSWLGVKDRSEIGTAQHEQFAKGFEQYLMEGKAPSIELRETFARVKQWFADLYRKLTTLGANLSDDVRGVFDRLLATDDEIANAEAEANAKPVFATAEDAGMSAREFAAYRATAERQHAESVSTLQKRLEGEARKAQTDVYREREAQARRAVTEDVRKRPVFLALNALQNGKLPDGDPLAESVKLDKADLVARNLDLKALPGPGRKRANSGRHVYTDDGGVTLDQAAELFGFSSGDDLYRALVAAPDQRQQVKVETEVRMRALYPDSMLDGSIYEKAADAVQNEHRADVIAAELKAMRKLAREAKPVAREAAQRATNLELAKGEAQLADAQAQAAGEVAYERALGEAKLGAAKDQAKAAAQADRAARESAFTAIPPVELVRAAAREAIRGKPVRDLNPNGYLVAVRKASREAFAAAARGDWAKAADAKQQELLSHELYRAAKDEAEAIDKGQRHLRELTKQRARERIGKAGGWEWTVTKPDGATAVFGNEAEAERASTNAPGSTYARTSGYLEQMDALLARFDLSTLPYAETVRRESLAAWIAEREAAGEQVAIPDEMRDEALRTNWRSLTVDQFHALMDAARNIEAMALNKNKLLTQQRGERLDAARTLLADTVKEHGGTVKSRAIGPGLFSAPFRAFGRFVGALRKMTSRLYEMDGFTHGALWDRIVRPLNEAADRERSDKAEASARYSELAKAWGKLGAGARIRHEIPGLDRPITLEQRIMVALNWGNEGNRKRLLRSFTESEVGAIIRSLDKSDMDFVQGNLDHINSYWSRIAAKQQRVTGVAPEKVDALPIETAHGVYRGGYFPVAYDPTRSTKAHGQLVAEQASLMKAGGYGAATTRRNHTKARAEDGLGVPLRLELGVINEHLNRVLHDLAYHETLIDTNRLLDKDGDIETAIRAHYGDGAMEDIRSALEDSAAGQVFAQDGMEKALSFIGSGASTASMAWNLQVALMNGTGFLQGIVRNGAVATAKAVGRLVSDAAQWKNAAAWVDESSPYMRERARLKERTIGDVNERLRLTGLLTPIRETFHYFVMKMDRAVGVLTWVAAHEKELGENGGDVARARAIADATVRETQGSNDPHDLASIQRGHPLKRLFTQFIHYANTTYTLRTEAIKRYGSQFEAPTSLPAIGNDLAATGKLAVDMALLYALPAVAVTAIRNALHPHQDKKKDATALEEVAGMFLGEIPLARDVGASLTRGLGYAGPTGTRGLEQIGELAGKLHQEWEHPKKDHGIPKAALSVAGVLAHWPTVQSIRTVEGFAYWLKHGGSPAPLIGGPPPKH